VPEESRKRTRADSQTSEREEIRRRAIGSNGKSRQDKAAAYFNSNFQRSKERFMASVSDLAKKPKPEPEAKYESPKAGRSETLTYTSPSEAQSAQRAESLHREEKPAGLFAPQQPAGGALFCASPAPAAVDSGALKPSVSEQVQQPSPSSLFGVSAPPSNPPPTTGASLFPNFSAPSTAPTQPASTPAVPFQPNMNSGLSITSSAQPTASPGPSTSAQTPSTLFGPTNQSMFGAGVMGQAAPKPPSLVQAPPPTSTPSLFGSLAPASEKPADTQAKALFGPSAGGFPGATNSSLFGTPKSEPVQPPPIEPADAAKSVFPATSTPSLFSAPTGNAAIPQFGSSSTPSGQAPLFGSTSTHASGSLFGNMASTASPNTLFGSAMKPAEGGMTSSLFGTLPSGFSQPVQGTGPGFGSGPSSLFGGVPSGSSLFPTNTKT